MSTMTVGKMEFTIVGTVSENDLYYEWHDGALLSDDEGNLFYLSGSGCSCNYFGEDETESDLVPVSSRQEAVELAKREFSDAEVYDFASQLF